MSLKTVFYLLQDQSLKARDLYACRLIEKAYNNKRKVYIHTVNFDEAQLLDKQIWTFRDISFIPHEIYNTNVNATNPPPIVIGYNATPNATEYNDVLINFALEIPKFYNQFQHIIEVVPNEDNLRASARKRYQYYQKQGCKMETINIDS